RHMLLALPVIAMMILPTYLNYREITQDNYQIGRFKGPEQETDYRDRLEGGISVSKGESKNILPYLMTVKDGYREGVPMIGLLAFVLMLYGISAGHRQSLFWLSILLFMCLNFIAYETPYHYVGFYLVPLYKMIRSYSFFSGFIALSATVLAALGLAEVLRDISGKKADGGTVLWKRAAAFSLCCIGVLLFLGTGDRILLAEAGLSIILLLFVMNRYLNSEKWIGRYKHLLLVLLLVAGGSNLSTVSGLDYHNAAGKLFSYGSKFSFSFERPDGYIEAHIPVLPETDFLSAPFQCCITFYNLAEKIDGPWYFDTWGSTHTLFVDRGYYHLSGTKGFEHLMKRKLHFFRSYTTGGRIEDFGPYLQRSVLVLEDDRGVKAKQSRVDLDMAGTSGAEPQEVTLLQKSANTAGFEISTKESAFMLYTDLYHKGFKAYLDGSEVPILKGMGVFKAIELPAGRHTVEFRFNPLYGYVLLLYLIVSVGFSGLMILCALREMLRRVWMVDGTIS
ncbi:MAG: hypothetical protein EPN25_08465, partial [Nitrospirae bacterium]